MPWDTGGWPTLYNGFNKMNRGAPLFRVLCERVGVSARVGHPLLIAESFASQHGESWTGCGFKRSPHVIVAACSLFVVGAVRGHLAIGQLIGVVVVPGGDGIAFLAVGLQHDPVLSAAFDRNAGRIRPYLQPTAAKPRQIG